MANITVRKRNGGEVVQPTATREWEPLRIMRSLMGWDPFREIEPTWPALEVEEFAPAFDVKEGKDSYVFKADLPGVEEKDIEVNLTGNRLSVSGKRESETEEKGENYYTCERSFGSFFRSFTLPDQSDLANIHSELRQGVLTIVVPKKPGTQAKKIEVKSGEKAKS